MESQGPTLITPRHIDDQQLAERYLADQLTDAERAELEEYYSDHPQVLKDLQAVAGIKAGLASLRASGELDQLTAQPRTRWHLGLALAASLLVATIGSGYLLRSSMHSGPVMAAATSALTNRAGVPLQILATYDLQRTRSDVDVIIAKPVATGAIQLRLRDVLDPPPATYRVELFAILPDDTRRSQASVDKVTTDDYGLLNVFLDPATLDLGSYQLRLLKDIAGATPAEVSDFLIDIVPDATEQSPANPNP
jgi:hypothetical protein